jgi:hypothetical protein
MPRPIVQARATNYRKMGVKLKSMRRKAKGIDVEVLNGDEHMRGRHDEGKEERASLPVVPPADERALAEWTFLLAMSVRNALEGFHADYLTDAQMAELNPLIRAGIYRALRALYLVTRGRTDQLRGLGLVSVAHFLHLVPSYWEAPGLTEDERQREQEFLQHPEWFLIPSGEAARARLLTFLREHLPVFQ